MKVASDYALKTAMLIVCHQFGLTAVLLVAPLERFHSIKFNIGHVCDEMDNHGSAQPKHIK